MSALPTDRITTRDLATRAEGMMGAMTASQRRSIETLIASLVEDGLAARALQAGQVAPDFILPDSEGRPVRLYTLLQRGPVVLVFYRGGWCGFCQTYLRGLQRELFYLRELDAELVAVSPQLPDASLRVETDHELAFPVLSDVGLKISDRFGLVYPLPASVRRTYRDFGVDLSRDNGPDGSDRLPLAATYVIGRDHIVHTAAMDEHPAQRLDPIDILAALVDLRTRPPSPRP